MSDLTTQEQTHVRTAMRFLRTRIGTWETLSKVLRFTKATLVNVSKGQTVSASLAVRIARLAQVSVDDVLTGRFPAPGTCPHCGHHASEDDEADILRPHTTEPASVEGT